MNPKPETTELPAEPVTRGSLRQQVTARLMMAIFRGQFRSGQRLVVQNLAAAYHASPTPVREALVELADLGLVELLPNRGAVVQPFGPREIREIGEVRRLLEVEATRCAAGRIPPAELASLEQELLELGGLPHDAAWDRRARAVDTRLHGLIAEWCGSRRLAAEVGRYLVLFRALRDVSHHRDAWTDYSRSNDVPEHLAIVAALRADDARAAARAMDRHIRSSAMAMEEVNFSGPEPPSSEPGSAGKAGASSSSPAAGSGGAADDGRRAGKGRRHRVESVSAAESAREVGGGFRSPSSPSSRGPQG